MKKIGFSKKKIAVICLIVVSIFVILTGSYIHNFLYGESVSYFPYNVTEENGCVTIEFLNFGSAAVISRITHEYIGENAYISVYSSFDVSKRIGSCSTKVYISENINKIYIKNGGSYEQAWQK